MNIEKWKRAVVHLEGARNSDAVEQRLASMVQMQGRYARGEVSPEEYEADIRQPLMMLDERFHGTALYVRHLESRYLVTARHVIADDVGRERKLSQRLRSEQTRLEQYIPQEEVEERLRSIEEATGVQIYPTIFRVPSLDEQEHPGHDYFSDVTRRKLSGLWDECLCSPTQDIAVIALESDVRTKLFADELDALGFAAISSDQIVDAPENEGEELFTVGFPEGMSPVRNVRETAWSHSARVASLPVFSFGRVAMVHRSLPYFLADLTISPGNSGGPVIVNDRMVGVVYQQPLLPLEGETAPTGVTSRAPFAFVLKAAEVRRLLDAFAAMCEERKRRLAPPTESNRD